MKRSLKQKRGLFLVMVLVFFGGNAAMAGSSLECETTVTGYICEIITPTADDATSAIAVADNVNCLGDWDYVYGIPFSYLENQLEHILLVGDSVEILAHACPMANPMAKLKACKVDGFTVFPPSKREDGRVSADANDNQGNYGQGRF